MPRPPAGVSETAAGRRTRQPDRSANPGSSPERTGGAGPFDAAIDADPDIGRAPLDVLFEIVVSGEAGAPQVRWDFGDGSGGSGSVVSHTYAQPGSYRAQATVENPATGEVRRTDVIIQVDPP